MIEYPSEEWIERLGRVFGRFRNKSVVLRGDGVSTYRNLHEVALAHIYKMTKKYYRENKIGTYYAQQKHLADQERTLWLLAQNFDVDREEVLEPMGHYDFIARPMEGTGTYDIGLVDLLYISANGDIPLILDFQYYNHVLVEQYNSVRFIQGLNFYGKFHLKTRFPVFQKDKLEVVEDWIYTKVRTFTSEEQQLFFWYEDEYKHPDEDEKTEYSSNHIKEELVEQIIGVRESSEELPNNPEKRKKWKYLCSNLDLLDYFDLLKQKNPKNDEPLLSNEQIEWIVGFYFGADQYTFDNKPPMNSNLLKNDLMFFIYQFSTQVSPGINSNGGVGLKDTVRILTECFPELFKGKPKSYSDTIANKLRSYDSKVKHLLDLSNHVALKKRINDSLRGV